MTAEPLDGQPRAGAFLFNLFVNCNKSLRLRALFPWWRVPVAQHAWAAMQREDGVRVGFRERTQ